MSSSTNTTEHAAGANAAAAPYTFFIVDDDQFLLDMYVLRFKEAGHTVEAFMESRKFLETLRAGHHADALIMDIVMPDIDGFSLLKTIKDEKLAGDAAIIVLSNQGQDSDVDRALEFGIDGYIVKASTVPSEVLSQIETIIKKKRSTKS